ncbi:MAG: DUF6580 family putative transport protein [Ferruginibacter sp.]
MKINSSLIVSFILLVVIASLYRIMPERPLGFAPQIAMAVFAGSIIKDKKYAFLLPLFSMLISDLIYEMLFAFKLSTIQGFYNGQWINYLLFCALTVIGFAVKPNKWIQIAGGSIAGVLFYFLASNFTVWIGGGLGLNNLPYAKTWDGLMQCYIAGIPFLKGSFYATFLFSGVFFGGYQLISKWANAKVATA